MPAPLTVLAARLRCPSCGASMMHADRVVTCARGHAFDVGRDGHVSLLPPRGKLASGDPPEMVAARASFLAAGHYAPIAGAVVAAAQQAVPQATTVVDLGAGTGSYLAAVLDGLDGAWGLALDASRAALRRAVRAHPRIAGIACDVWHDVPLQTASADLVINVFAPRNAPEVRRVLDPRGAFVVATPAPDHLRELATPFGTVGIDPSKRARLDAELSPYFSAAGRRHVAFELALGREEVEALVGMGPTAYHLGADEIRSIAASLPEPFAVTTSVIVETYRPVPTASSASR